MRLALDVSKAGARDGIGSWTRGLVRGLSQCLTAEDRQDMDRVLLYDLTGSLDDEVLRDEFGDLGPHFESRLGGSLRQAEAGRDADVFLATSWQVPADCRLPVIFVVYDLTFLSHPSCHTVDNRIHSLEGCLRALLSGAGFLAISAASADELSRHLDVPRSEIEVVHPGLEPCFTAASRTGIEHRLRDRFGLASGYVLAVGSLEPRKNLQRLIEAHRRLNADLRRDHPLVVVGSGGWHNASLEQVLHSAEARGDVHRMGRVTGTDLVSLYNGAALFVYPSLAEGFGLPVLEAMACGTPVLTSDRSSMPEVAGDAARLIDPESTEAIHRALAELLPDAVQLKNMSLRGLRRAQAFSWPRAAGRILDACRQTAGTST